MVVAYADGVIVQSALDGDIEGFGAAVARETGTVPIWDETPPAAIRDAVLESLRGPGASAALDLARLRPFQRRVLEATARIPAGEVRAYGWVAREIGAPGAARAVGTALARNPFAPLIPCHRVVRADGGMGEYSSGGPAVKRRLLEREGARPQP